MSGAGSAERCHVYLVFRPSRGLKYALLHRSVCDSALRDVSRVTEALLAVTVTRSNNPSVSNVYWTVHHCNS